MYKGSPTCSSRCLQKSDHVPRNMARNTCAKHQIRIHLPTSSTKMATYVGDRIQNI